MGFSFAISVYTSLLFLQFRKLALCDIMRGIDERSRLVRIASTHQQYKLEVKLGAKRNMTLRGTDHPMRILEWLEIIE